MASGAGGHNPMNRFAIGCIAIKGYCLVNDLNVCLMSITFMNSGQTFRGDASDA